jgi:hypothetical protein
MKNSRLGVSPQFNGFFQKHAPTPLNNQSITVILEDVYFEAQILQTRTSLYLMRADSSAYHDLANW